VKCRLPLFFLFLFTNLFGLLGALHCIWRFFLLEIGIDLLDKLDERTYRGTVKVEKEGSMYEINESSKCEISGFGILPNAYCYASYFCILQTGYIKTIKNKTIHEE